MKPYPHPTGWLPPFTVAPFFSEAEAETIRHMALKELPPVVRAQRVSDAGEGYVDDQYRRCLTCDAHPGTDVYNTVAQRLTRLLPSLNEHYGFDLHKDMAAMLPFFQINHYRGSDHGRIGYHHDLGGMKEVEERKLSLSILLNGSQAFQGGDLMLHDGDVYYPLKEAKAGTAVAFPSFTMHEVEEVTEGDRWSMVLWLHGPRFR